MHSAPSVRKQRRQAERAARRGQSAAFRRLLLRVLAAAVLLGLLAVAVLAFRAWTTDPLARGREALAVGDDRAARVDLTAVLTENPRDIGARIDLARALNGLGRGVEAERQLARAEELGAPEEAVRVERARALLDQGRATDALVALAGPIRASESETAMRVAAQAQYRLGNIAAARAAFGRAIDSGQSVDSWIAFARFRLDEQDMLGADRAADEAIRRRPDSAAAWAMKADVVRARGGPVPALAWYEAALRRNHDHVPTLLAYAATLGDAGRGAAMLEPLQHAADLEPAHPQGLALRAMLAARGGEPALARTLLNRIGGPTREVPAVLLTRAAVALMLDTPVDARDLAAMLVERQPDNRSARRLLALALARTDNPRGAIEVIDPITISADADAWSLLLLSRGFAGIGQPALANEPLTRAYSLARGLSAPLPSALAGGDSLDPRVAIPAIRARLAAGQAGSALVLAGQLADANPGVPQARLLVGDAALVSGDAAGAAREFRRAAELRFDQQTMMRLVAALSLAGDRNGAGEAIDQYLARWPNDAVAMRVAGNFAAEGGNWPVARDYLGAALARLGTNDALLLAQVARAELEVGDAAAALPYAARAYRLFPGNATTSGVYGLALHRNGGDRTDAHELMVKAVQLAPGDALLLRWAREVG
jgi:tetratricopeptide (TPR) repeat protein